MRCTSVGCAVPVNALSSRAAADLLLTRGVKLLVESCPNVKVGTLSYAGIDVRHEYNYEMHVQAVTKGPEISSATDTLCSRYTRRGHII